MSALENIVCTLETPEYYSLIMVIVWAIEQFYATVSISPLLIGYYARTRAADFNHKDLMQEVLKRTSESAKIKFLVRADKSFGSLYEHYSFFEHVDDEDLIFYMFGDKDKAIWFVDSIESFSYLEADLLNERRRYRRNGYFCIIYTGQEHNRLQKFYNIFKRLFFINVINANILVIADETINVYTYFPFTFPKCRDFQPKLYASLGPLTNYSYSEKDFFKKKLNNLWSCSLTVTTWEDRPYMIIKNNKYYGIEGLLLTELSKRMNFSIHLKPQPENDRGIYFKNKTATGALKLLMESETNITIACMMLVKDRLKIADASYSYMNPPMNVVIPKGHQMRPLERLFRPFQIFVWICLIFSIFIGMFLIFILRYTFNAAVQTFVFGNGNRIPLTNLWNVLYGGPIYGSLPRRNFARYLLALWIIYAWILRSAYVSELFTILQDSRARSNLKTLSEVIQKNYTFYAYDLVAPFIREKSSSANIKYFDQDKNTLQKLFYRLGHENTKFVITTEIHYVLYYNQQINNKDYRVNILPEPIWNTPVTVYMPRHSYIKDKIDENIVRFMSAGLISRFEKLYTGKIEMFKKKKEPDVLSLWLLLGIFTIYSILIILCFLIFLLELCTRRVLLIRKIIDFLNY